MTSSPTFYEFFAGGGMARAGLGKNWQCLFANDIDPMKATAYAANWGDAHFSQCDVAALLPENLPGAADLVWASFPCQDLSLAGNYAGLGPSDTVTTRSGTFWPFWKLMKSLARAKREPRLIILENVTGCLTSNGGRDFVAIASALAEAGYRFGAVVIDAVHFVPQSRSRVFYIAVKEPHYAPAKIMDQKAQTPWHPKALLKAYEMLSPATKERWVWWRLPVPAMRRMGLLEIIEDQPQSVTWHTRGETDRLLEMMSSANRAKVEEASGRGKRTIGTIYKRTRPTKDGGKIQRAEVRFDDIAGCLRTPGGGSSRQSILIVEGERIRSRLLSAREAARLMGLPDSYKLPVRYNDAYKVVGDGVCPPVVRYLAEHILEPLLLSSALGLLKAA